MPLGDPLDADHEPPRRAERVNGRLGTETPLAQLRREHFADLIRQGRQPAGRNFLAADLEQQFAVHGYRPTGYATTADVV